MIIRLSLQIMLLLYVFNQLNAQVINVYKGGDILDIYLGEVDSAILSNNIKMVTECDCFYDSVNYNKIVRLIKYNQEGRIDSIIEGQNIMNGAYSLIITYSYKLESGQLIVNSLRKYFRPINRYSYDYLYKQEGNNYTLAWPKTGDDTVELNTKYAYLTEGTVRKRLFDGNGKQHIDTLIYLNAYKKQHQVESVTQKERVILFSENGQQFKRKEFFVQGQIERAEVYKKQKGKYDLVFKILFFYNSTGLLIKKIKYSSPGQKILEQRDFEYKAENTNPVNTIVNDYVNNTEMIFDSHLNCLEFTENNLPNKYVRKIKNFYNGSGLIEKRETHINNKLIMASCYLYK